MFTEKGYSMQRRRFLRTLGLAVAGLPFAERIVAATDEPVAQHPGFRRAVRIRGVVRIDEKGKPGVGVSDGQTVVTTAADGTYELISDTSSPFVFLSLPSSVGIPVSPRGSAAAFRPVLPDSRGEMSAAWDLKSLAITDERHAFFLLADPQTLDMDDIALFHTTTVPDVKASARALTDVPVFGVGCGDLMFDRLELFPEYEKGIAQTGVPFFQVLGNHDVDALAKTDELSTATFMRLFGPTYYSFNRGAVHYVVLDDVMWLGDGYIGYLTQRQLDWLRADLALVEAGRPVFVFMHIPSYCTQHIRTNSKRPERSVVVANRDFLMELLAPYRAHVVVGHMHETEHVYVGNAHIHVCGAVCGAWWSGPICGDGTPNGYGVYEIQGEDVRWRYKSTGMPADHQIRIYPRGTDPAHANAILANIWDWDQSWTVVWYENGVRKGEMQQIRRTDPLSEKLHTGPVLPAKHTWVEPYVTDHMFKAVPESPEGAIVVEARDRFGRIFTARG